MLKMLIIPVTTLFICFIPREIHNALAKPDPQEVIWKSYCQEHGIDPENPSEEEENYFYDVYWETDECQEIYNLINN